MWLRSTFERHATNERNASHKLRIQCSSMCTLSYGVYCSEMLGQGLWRSCHYPAVVSHRAETGFDTARFTILQMLGPVPLLEVLVRLVLPISHNQTFSDLDRKPKASDPPSSRTAAQVYRMWGTLYERSLDSRCIDKVFQKGIDVSLGSLPIASMVRPIAIVHECRILDSLPDPIILWKSIHDRKTDSRLVLQFV